MKRGTRNSSIEAAKVAAIIMIVISHCVPLDSGDFFGIANATRDMDVFFSLLCRNLGQIGNDIFLISSVWFLTECDEIRSKKILSIMMDCFLISLTWMGLFLVMGYRFPAQVLIRQFFPVLFGNNWYITCYLLLYLIHPVLNIIIRQCNKRYLLLIVCIVGVLYFGIAFLYEYLIFYNRFIGFVGVYFVVAYIKKFLGHTRRSLKVNISLLTIGILGWLIEHFLTNWIGLHVAFLEDNMLHWNHFNNPFFMCIGISVFNMVECRVWHNKAVNYLSALSLLIYVITENYLFKNYVFFDCFVQVMDFFGTGASLVGTILSCTLIMLLGGVLASILYRCTVQKAVAVVCGWLDEIGHKAANRILTVLMRAE